MRLRLLVVHSLHVHQFHNDLQILSSAFLKNLDCSIFFAVGLYCLNKPILVAVRSTAWVCDRSLAGIVGSNPAGSMDVVSVVCCQRCVCRTDHSSKWFFRLL